MRRVFVDKKFSILRKRVKHSQKKVMDCIIADHNADICVLCGSSDDITREHIIPQWAFESNAEKSLINKKNNQSTHYIKATVPACRVCNSDLLGVFEYNLKKFLTEKRGEELTDYEYDCIIWWLQYMGFKLQLMDLRNRFLRYKGVVIISRFLQTSRLQCFGGMSIRRRGMSSGLYENRDAI